MLRPERHQLASDVSPEAQERWVGPWHPDDSLRSHDRRGSNPSWQGSVYCHHHSTAGRRRPRGLHPAEATQLVVRTVTQG